MYNLILIKASLKYQTQIEDMLKEWKEYNSNHPSANTSPFGIFRPYKDFNEYIYLLNDYMEHYNMYDNTKVPGSTYFALDLDKNIMVGAVNIRHYLNDHLLEAGGHIGDGIRPSQRGKGYAKEMLILALKECKKLGIDRVLMTCDKSNIPSRKSIISVGGIKENEVFDDGEIVERYWIDNN